MKTKILYRIKLSKKYRSYLSFDQNHWFYLLPTLRFNTEYKWFKISEISFVWLFWEIGLFIGHEPCCMDDGCTCSVLEHVAPSQE